MAPGQTETKSTDRKIIVNPTFRRRKRCMIGGIRVNKYRAASRVQLLMGSAMSLRRAQWVSKRPAYSSAS